MPSASADDLYFFIADGVVADDTGVVKVFAGCAPLVVTLPARLILLDLLPLVLIHLLPLSCPAATTASRRW